MFVGKFVSGERWRGPSSGLPLPRLAVGRIGSTTTSRSPPAAVALFVPKAQRSSKGSSLNIYAVFAHRSDGVVVSMAPCTSHEAIAAVRKFRDDGCSNISIYRNARSIEEVELKMSAEREGSGQRLAGT